MHQLKRRFGSRLGQSGAHTQGNQFSLLGQYGLKNSGQAWRSHFAQTLEKLGFKSSFADPDVWYKPSVKASGEEYYTYLLVYVDDLLLCIDEHPKKYMDMIERDFKIKEGSVGPPRVYLGANCQKIPSRTDGVDCWGMSTEQYCKEAVKNVKKKKKEKRKTQRFT